MTKIKLAFLGCGNQKNNFDALCMIWGCVIYDRTIIKFSLTDLLSTATVAPTVNSSLLLRCDRKTIHLTKSSGTIRSPGYPHEYAENQRCTWRVQVPRGFRIRIRFRRQFDIEQSPQCSKDYLMLSVKKNFRDVPKHCGSTRPSSFLVRNSVWIRFRSDNNTTGKGFYISYTSEGKYIPLTFNKSIH